MCRSREYYQWYKVFKEERDIVEKAISGPPSTSLTDENIKYVKELELKDRHARVIEVIPIKLNFLQEQFCRLKTNMMLIVFSMFVVQSMIIILRKERQQQRLPLASIEAFKAEILSKQLKIWKKNLWFLHHDRE